MNFVSQPIKSNQCGQACVAMVCGLSLEDSLMIFRRKGQTRTKQLVQALWQMGIKCGNKLTRGFPKEGSAILKFTNWCGRSHWVVWHENKYYDPIAGVSREVPKWLADWRVTSYLKLILEKELRS